MKVVVYIALSLCVVWIITGIAVWFTSNSIFLKFLASSITIAPGLAFGKMIVDMLKEE